MLVSTVSYMDIVNRYINDWSERNQSSLLKSKEKGCFVWDAKEHGLSDSSGMFYTCEMLPAWFKGPLVDMTKKLIQECDSEREFVVVLSLSSGKVIRLLLHSTK